MPRGKYVNHKGRSRNFTSPEELEEERKKNALKKQNKLKTEDGEEEETSSEEEEEDVKKKPVAKGGDDSESEEEEDDDESDEDTGKAKGVQGLIEIENPNRVQKKAAVKVGDSSKMAKPELTRREREELEKQQAAARYQKLHAEGKTSEARADLARLAIIKQHRAEAAARREAEKKEKDAAPKK